jgi:hypothetical protein
MLHWFRSFERATVWNYPDIPITSFEKYIEFRTVRVNARMLHAKRAILQQTGCWVPGSPAAIQIFRTFSAHNHWQRRKWDLANNNKFTIDFPTAGSEGAMIPKTRPV